MTPWAQMIAALEDRDPRARELCGAPYSSWHRWREGRGSPSLARQVQMLGAWRRATGLDAHLRVEMDTWGVDADDSRVLNVVDARVEAPAEAASAAVSDADPAKLRALLRYVLPVDEVDIVSVDRGDEALLIVCEPTADVVEQLRAWGHGAWDIGGGVVEVTP